ncbi:MAG TPA: hypothetical protein VIK53_03505 [Verrucomicrobiae bacterium]
MFNGRRNDREEKKNRERNESAAETLNKWKSPSNRKRWNMRVVAALHFDTNATFAFHSARAVMR